LLFRARAQLARKIVEHSLRLRELRIGKGKTGEKKKQGTRGNGSSEGFMHFIKLITRAVDWLREPDDAARINLTRDRKR
jgi:hypothetical protein